MRENDELFERFDTIYQRPKPKPISGFSTLRQYHYQYHFLSTAVILQYYYRLQQQMLAHRNGTRDDRLLDDSEAERRFLNGMALSNIRICELASLCTKYDVLLQGNNSKPRRETYIAALRQKVCQLLY